MVAELAAELVAAPLDLDALAALVAARRGDDAGRAAVVAALANVRRRELSGIRPRRDRELGPRPP